jgi:hypothetical protein
MDSANNDCNDNDNKGLLSLLTPVITFINNTLPAPAATTGATQTLTPKTAPAPYISAKNPVEDLLDKASRGTLFIELLETIPSVNIDRKGVFTDASLNYTQKLFNVETALHAAESQCMMDVRGINTCQIVHAQPFAISICLFRVLTTILMARFRSRFLSCPNELLKKNEEENLGELSSDELLYRWILLQLISAKTSQDIGPSVESIMRVLN